MSVLSNYLDALTDEEVQQIASSFKHFEIGNEIVTNYIEQSQGISDSLKLEVSRQFIIKVMDKSGCVYDEEIDHCILCLKKGIEKYRLGDKILFDPHLWEHTMAVEKLFDIKLSEL